MGVLGHCQCPCSRRKGVIAVKDVDVVIVGWQESIKVCNNNQSNLLQHLFPPCYYSYTHIHIT